MLTCQFGNASSLNDTITGGIKSENKGNEGNNTQSRGQQSLRITKTTPHLDTPAITSNLSSLSKVQRLRVIQKFCNEGFLREAISMIDIMDQQSIRIFSNTYICLLKACITTNTMVRGKELHARILKTRFNVSLFLFNMIVNMYAKCGGMQDAHNVFDRMPDRNIYTWTIIIGGYADQGNGNDAIRLFCDMRMNGTAPNVVTYVCVLSVCTLAWGKHLHSDAVKMGLNLDTYVGNSLIGMYMDYGDVEDAIQVFSMIPVLDMISWNSLISGYIQYAGRKDVIILVDQMQLHGLKPNTSTYISMLTGCAAESCLEWGKYFHAYLKGSALVSDVFISSTLIDMYAKCGDIRYARQVFDMMHARDIISWNVLIAGYAIYGDASEAIKLFKRIEQYGLKADVVTYAIAFNACTNAGNLKLGKHVHAQLIRDNMGWNLVLENTLVDMYAKCGSMNDARHVFDHMSKQNLVSWTAIISGYAEHGCAKEALKLFQAMECFHARPNAVTFISILVACSHMGLVDNGYYYFLLMTQLYEIQPEIEHYSCLVDLASRAGCLYEAFDLINAMPVKADAVIWMAFLGGCNIYLDMKLAKCGLDQIVKVDPLYLPA